MKAVILPRHKDDTVQLSRIDFRPQPARLRVGPWEIAVSFQDFKWACGHIGPAYCKQCHEEMKVKS